MCNEKEQNCPIVFVDISDLDNSLISYLENIKLFTSKIIITSIDYSTNNIIKAMRLGAREFLPKPIIENDLKRILTVFLQKESQEDDSASKIITIYSKIVYTILN